jgi:hypothetical protein
VVKRSISIAARNLNIGNMNTNGVVTILPIIAAL